MGVGGHKPCPSGQGWGSGVWASDHLTGLQPRKGGGVGCGVGGGVGRGGIQGTLRKWRRRGIGDPEREGREEGRGAENEGSIPDASLWLPQPPAGQDQSTGTGGRTGGPALSPFQPFLRKTNELPALLFTSHRCGQ